MRMLDNVIDINYYAVDKARNSTVTVRWAWASWGSRTACTGCACRVAGGVSSPTARWKWWRTRRTGRRAELAEERGRYASFPGSLWDRGILPQDTLDMSAERGGYVELDRSARLDWERLRAHQAARHAQLQLPRHRTLPRPSPTSSACRPRSSRPTRTCS